MADDKSVETEVTEQDMSQGQDGGEVEFSPSAEETVQEDGEAVTGTLVEEEAVMADGLVSDNPEVLKKQLAEAEKKIQEHWDTILRQKADQENLRKRAQRDLENAHKYALERFANELLPIKDSLEMGLQAASAEDADIAALREGSELILKMFVGAMEKFGIEEIDPKQGDKFDPHKHEAMVMTPAPDAEPNTVLLVHQKGYQLNERLLRAARVVVAKRAD